MRLLPVDSKAQRCGRWEAVEERLDGVGEVSRVFYRPGGGMEPEPKVQGGLRGMVRVLRGREAGGPRCKITELW